VFLALPPKDAAVAAEKLEEFLTLHSIALFDDYKFTASVGRESAQ